MRGGETLGETFAVVGHQVRTHLRRNFKSFRFLGCLLVNDH